MFTADGSNKNFIKYVLLAVLSFVIVYLIVFTFNSMSASAAEDDSETYSYTVTLKNRPYDYNGFTGDFWFCTENPIVLDLDYRIAFLLEGSSGLNGIFYYKNNSLYSFDTCVYFGGKTFLKPDGTTYTFDSKSYPADYINFSTGYVYSGNYDGIPRFIDRDAMISYLSTGDDSGQVNKPREVYFDSSIETPQLVFTDGLRFYINNASDNYNIEIQGRCYSVDDIELFKENLLWKYKYSTIVKNELSTWVSIDDDVLSSGEHDLYNYGSSSFSNLLSLYPIDERNYYGGTNAVGNYFSGYSDALEQLKTVLLPTHGTLFNGTEIYIRFYYIEDNVVHYGKWCHWYDSLANSEGSSGSQWDDKDFMFTESQSDIGLTDSEKDVLENSGNSQLYDDDAKPIYNNTSSWESKTGDEVWNVMQSMIDSLGDFPSMVQSVFSFLPDWIFALIGVGIGFVVILRFLGR